MNLFPKGGFGVRHNLSTLQMKNKKERGIIFKQLVSQRCYKFGGVRGRLHRRYRKVTLL